MVESIVGALAVAGITVSAGLSVAVMRLNRRSHQLHKALITLQKEVAARRTLPANDEVMPISSLGGLRIALGISQDHAIPTLSLLVKDALGACDAEVTLLDSFQCKSLIDNWESNRAGNSYDVLIWGEITCNGYRDIYYKASLNYLTPYGKLNPIIEQPAQGNPQSSLVVTIVSKLKKELNLAQRRNERSAAIQELRPEGVPRQAEK